MIFVEPETSYNQHNTLLVKPLSDGGSLSALSLDNVRQGSGGTGFTDESELLFVSFVSNL